MNSQLTVLVSLLATLHAINAAIILPASLKSESTVNPAACGLANVKQSPFAGHFGVATLIQNGYPWMVKIRTMNEAGQVFRNCSGTLINKEWILTAASCLPNGNSSNNYVITLGDHKVSSRSLSINVGAAKIIHHPGYQAFNLKNDIALIQLNIPVTYANNTRPACVPEQDFPTDADRNMFFNNKYVTYAGKLCTVLSWGETEQEQNDNILKHKLVSIYPRTICNRVTSLYPGYLSHVESSGTRFCAKNIILKEACKARPGAPLLCTDDSNRYYLHGIMSFGPQNCGLRFNLPDVYTEVAAYRNWIEEEILQT